METLAFLFLICSLVTKVFPLELQKNQNLVAIDGQAISRISQKNKIFISNTDNSGCTQIKPYNHNKNPDIDLDFEVLSVVIRSYLCSITCLSI